MITTVLFDLDGTLLPMDQDALIAAYLNSMAAKMAGYGYDPKRLVKSVWEGTGAMMQNSGNESNEEVFWEMCSKVYGRNVRCDEPIFLEYYGNEFQDLKNCCAVDTRAAATVHTLQEEGYRLILATNPLFPAVATHSRIRWAGLQPEDFVWITTYENASRCKPNPDYYREILDKLNLQPEECLMVGNDAEEDMVAASLGMKVFLLTDCLINKQGAELSRYPQGSFPELMDYIRSI